MCHEILTLPRRLTRHPILYPRCAIGIKPSSKTFAAVELYSFFPLPQIICCIILWMSCGFLERAWNASISHSGSGLLLVFIFQRAPLKVSRSSHRPKRVVSFCKYFTHVESPMMSQRHPPTKMRRALSENTLQSFSQYKPQFAYRSLPSCH